VIINCQCNSYYISYKTKKCKKHEDGGLQLYLKTENCTYVLIQRQNEMRFHTMITSIVYRNLHLLSNFICIQIYKNMYCSRKHTRRETQRNGFFVSFDFVDLPPRPRNSSHEKFFYEKAILTVHEITRKHETRTVWSDLNGFDCQRCFSGLLTGGGVARIPVHAFTTYRSCSGVHFASYTRYFTKTK